MFISVQSCFFYSGEIKNTAHKARVTQYLLPNNTTPSSKAVTSLIESWNRKTGWQPRLRLCVPFTFVSVRPPRFQGPWAAQRRVDLPVPEPTRQHTPHPRHEWAVPGWKRKPRSGTPAYLVGAEKPQYLAHYALHHAKFCDEEHAQRTPCKPRAAGEPVSGA